MKVAPEKNACTENFPFSGCNPILPRLISDHLGSVRVTLDQTGNVDSWTDYYPFGKESRSSSSANKPREQFTGKERDAESGLDYFGARYYNADIARWVSVDPMNGKYPSLTPYNYAASNPISFVDPNGLDVVYFDDQGNEINRMASDKRFETYVRVAEGTSGSVSSEVSGVNGSFMQAAMPKAIPGYEDAKYQTYDYDIAANTFLFNQQLANDPGSLPTPSDFHSLAENADMPNALDPTLVKAMALEESKAGTYTEGAGTGTTDVMQVNNSGDWATEKTRVGLTQSQTMTPNASIKASIKWLYLKGMTSDDKGKMNWGNKNGTWNHAVRKYNGGGNPNYKEEVMGMYDDANK